MLIKKKNQPLFQWKSCFGNTVFFWFILIIILIWKLLIINSVELIFDECYYWSWTSHLQISYFDHPPLIAWMIAGSKLLFSKKIFSVRIGTVLCGLILLLSGRYLAKDMFGIHAGNRAGLFLMFAPLYMGNSLLMTPDAPLAASWSLGLLATWKGIFKGEGSWLWTIVAGIAFGLGLLSKYTMCLFYISVCFIWIIAYLGDIKKLFQIILVGAIGFIFFLPVIYWNQTHHWISFHHQWHHGFYNEHHTLIHWNDFLDYMIFIIFLVSPLLGLFCLGTYLLNWQDNKVLFLNSFFWIVILFFGYSALTSHIEANWALPAFISALILISGKWEIFPFHELTEVILLLSSCGMMLFISLIPIAKQKMLFWHQKIIALSLLNKQYLQPVKKLYLSFEDRLLSEFFASPQIAKKIVEIFMQSHADFILVNTYQMYGILSFYAPTLENKIAILGHDQERFFWINGREWIHKNALIIAWLNPNYDITNFFKSVENKQYLSLSGIEHPWIIEFGRDFNDKNFLSREKNEY